MSDLQYDKNADIAARKHELYVATRIEALLKEPEVDKALNGMLHGFQNAWLTEMNKEARELLWIKAQGLQEFLNTLQDLITTGKLAAAQLASMRDDQEGGSNGE